MSDIKQKLLAAFDAEYRDHLALIREVLQHVTSLPAPLPGSSPQVAEAFRRAHSLKGAARIVDLPHVTNIAHRLEALFTKIQVGQVLFDAVTAAVVAAAVDAIEDEVSSAGSGHVEPLSPDILRRIEERLAAPAPQPVPAASPAALVPPQAAVDTAAAPIATITAHAAEATASTAATQAVVPTAPTAATQTVVPTAPTAATQAAEATASTAATHAVVPTAPTAATQAAEATPLPTGEKMAVAAAPTAPAAIAVAARPVSATPAMPLPAASAAAVPPQVAKIDTTTNTLHETFRLSAVHFDRLMKSAGEVVGFSRNYEDHVDHLRRLGTSLEGLEKNWGTLVKTLGKRLKKLPSHGDTSDRLSMQMAHMESEMRLLGRQLRVATGKSRNMNYSFRALGEQLQQEVQTARLVPAVSLLESFPKMMRDLAKEAGKELDYHMHGADQEVDRVVMQALKDPVMHILRNSLSHGIETPEARLRSGKKPRGSVTLALEITARRLNLTVTDDGAGLDLAAIKAKAVAAGLVAAADADRLGTDEIIRLIFREGLSTARELSEISGRGMGLSVVAEAMARLGGEVDVQLGETCGTRFCLSVPLTLSTQRLLLVKCQDQLFALPIYAVQAVRRVKRDQIAMIEGRPTVVIDSRNVALAPLGQMLDMRDKTLLTSGDMLALVIVKSGRRRLAVAVDELVGEREGMVKNFGPPMNASPRFNGALAAGRQGLALVINTNALFASQQRHSPGQPLVTYQHKQEKRKRHILVVDDSFTTRILEKSILEANGYQVDVAIDGLEALKYLESTIVDLIISDVEMPRLDGLGLLQRVKANPKSAHIPVIMVSSCDQPEDRQRGLTLGADAYLPKQGFNQDVLLDTIKQVI